MAGKYLEYEIYHAFCHYSSVRHFLSDSEKQHLLCHAYLVASTLAAEDSKNALVTLNSELPKALCDKEALISKFIECISWNEAGDLAKLIGYYDESTEDTPHDLKQIVKRIYANNELKLLLASTAGILMFAELIEMRTGLVAGYTVDKFGLDKSE